MKTLFSLILSAALLPAQNVPVVTGHNPSVQLGTALYNEGTVRVFTGTGAPTAPTLNAGISDIAPVRGDYYFDTSTTPVTVYTCAAATCSTAANWQQAAYPLAVSVTAFGVSGSSSTDAANLQTAITAASGHFCLYIPAGLTVQMANNAVVLYSNTCISGAGPSLSKVAGNGLLATAGVGIFTVYANASNVSIKDIGFDGGITSPTGVLYSTAGAGGPQQFANGSTILVNAGVTGLTIKHNQFNHTNGYAIYATTSSAISSHWDISDNSDINARPYLFGTSSLSLIYGSWTGGFLFYSLGSGSDYYVDIKIDNNFFQNVTGNCIWFHTLNFSGTGQNRQIQITNNRGLDVGLDFIQTAMTVGLIETGNEVNRFGYVVTSDVGATRVGGPLWLQNYVPVAYDMAGEVSSFTISNNAATGNGEGIDLDGGWNGSITGNTLTSCWGSYGDTLASSTSCGPSSAVGQNYAPGIVSNNSIALASVGSEISIVGNTLNDFGGGALNLYGVNNSTIVGNTILHPSAAFSPPITLGNLPSYPAAFNLVTKNTINWPSPSGAPAVNEDGSTYSACVGIGQSNTVNGNTLLPPTVLGGLMYEFQKCSGSNSGTGNLNLSTVTAGGSTLTSMVLQTEGSAGFPYLSIYSNAGGTGSRNATFSPGGFQPVSVPFASWAGIVNTAGTNVTPASGSFSGIVAGQTITITSVPYTIATVVSSSLLTITTSAGTQSSASASVSGLPSASTYPGSIIVCTLCTHNSNPCTLGTSKTMAFSDGTAWACY